MSRLGDVVYFLRQIFFPNWINRENDAEPTAWQKFLAGILLFLTSRNGTGTIFSIVLHAFLLVLLTLFAISPPGNLAGIDILGNFVPFPGERVVIAPPQVGESNDNDNDNGEQQNVLPDEPDTQTQEQPTTPDQTESPASSEGELSEEEWLKTQSVGGFSIGGGFQNRNTAGRQHALQGGGSSRASEAAVESALAWLAYHQQRDGGWSLHFADSCRHCSHSGTSATNRRTAATALALLPFLGAGYSHQVESPYRSNVERGLLFLIKDGNGGMKGEAFRRDQLKMYSYGLAAIALCEAFAMTKEQDPGSQLGIAAQEALLFIETAQDPDYGGWNYRPDQLRRDVTREFEGVRVGGDTSIFAWQLMALKSGKIGGLHVSPSVLYAALVFLDSVALDGGRRHQYRPDGMWDVIRGEDSPQPCTAIGLLMRMYLGWKPGNPFLDDGMDTIVRWGHTLKGGETNLYYAYHATLALHHYGGEHWAAWNSGLQEMLIRTQSREGCESGSWHFRDPYCDVGGRLLSTALAAMILETPYRIMPLYRELR
jgi:hypothetical protein